MVSTAVSATEVAAADMPAVMSPMETPMSPMSPMSPMMGPVMVVRPSTLSVVGRPIPQRGPP